MVNSKTIILVVCIFALFGMGVWYWQNGQAPSASPTPSPTANSQIYRNDQYGFSIALSESWKGYSVIDNQWEGRSVTLGKVMDQGPLIIIRHPQWTATDQHEDMPIMIFTPGQWTLVQQEKMSVGAAPIPPSILSQNSKYIMALPARYNYDYKTGWEEVDQLAHTLKAFEPVVK